MFENLTNQFNGLFGKVALGMCRLTVNGKIAVKCSNGHKSYDVKKGTLTNVTNFCFNVGDEMFFVIPTNKVEVGDIILVSGKPKCVTQVDKKIITVIDYENSEVRQVVPERHVFMGSTYFYGKIISMFGNAFKDGKGLGNVMKMMMFSSMIGGKDSNNNMGQMMAMSMFMGSKESPFEGMFDFSLIQEDRTNHYNDGQGEFRYGKLDIDSLYERIRKDAHGVPFKLELTHCDEFDNTKEIAKLFHNFNTYESPII